MLADKCYPATKVRGAELMAKTEEACSRKFKRRKPKTISSSVISITKKWVGSHLEEFSTGIHKQ